MSVEDVEGVSREAKFERDLTRGPLDTDPSNTPEFWSPLLFSQLSVARKGKATGLDGIPCEVLKAAGGGFADALSHLVVSVGEGGAPAAWKGGLMATVPRKPKQALTTQNARGILCASSIANSGKIE